MKQRNIPGFGHVTTELETSGFWSAVLVVKGAQFARVTGYAIESVAIRALVDCVNELAGSLTRMADKAERSEGSR